MTGRPQTVDRTRLVELWTRGETAEEVARDLSCSRRYAVQLARKLGLAPHPRPVFADSLADGELNLNAGLFWEKVEKSDGCWRWLGSFYPNGYGCYAVRRYPGRRNYLAHRVAFILTKGPIPEGLDLDHLCRNRGCCNPAHVEPVTRQENLLRGETLVAANARKTHCVHGHALTPENTYDAGRSKRNCRECKRQRDRR